VITTRPFDSAQGDKQRGQKDRRAEVQKARRATEQKSNSKYNPKDKEHRIL